MDSGKLNKQTKTEYLLGQLKISGGGNFPKCTIAYMVDHSFKNKDTVNNKESIKEKMLKKIR